MRRYGFLALLALSIWLMAGCGTSQTQLSFIPEKGDARTYRLFSRAEFQMRGATTANDVVLETEGLMRYRAGGADQPMSITPLNLCVSGQKRTRAYCSAWSDARAPKLLAVLRSGFQLPTTGAGAHWPRASDTAAASALADEAPDLARLLPRQFVAPGVFSGLEATPGSTLTLDSIAGLPPAVLTVMTVTPEHVFVSLAPAVDGDHLAGHLVIDRRSGWIERMAAVYESSASMGGRQEPVRQLIALAPADWSEQSLRHHYEAPRYDSSSQGQVYITFNTRPTTAVALDEDDPSAPAALTEAEVFPTAVGGFKANRSWGVELDFDHALWRDKQPRFGRLAYRDLTPLDDNDQAIDLDLAGGYMRTGSDTHTGNLHTSNRRLPLGFEQVAERVERIAAISAKADYYPIDATDTLTLDLQADDHGPIRIDGESGITATLTPQGEHNYLLTLSGRRDYLSALMLEREPPAFAAERNNDLWPDWVRPGERDLFTTILGNGSARLLPLHIDPKAGAVTVAVRVLADQPALTKPVRFIPYKARYNALDIGPGVHVPLYFVPSRLSTELHGAQQVPAVADDKLKPRAIDSGAPIFALSPEQSALCTLSATTPNGKPVGARWQVIRQEYPTFGDGADRQMLATLRWRLIADDGGPANTEGAVELGLRCRARQWHTADYDLGKRPWLIDLQRLTGEQPDPAMPLGVLLGRYRLLDADNQPLSVLPAEFDHFWDYQPANARLGPFLVDGRYLRIAGRPTTVEVVEAGDITIDKHWRLPAAASLDSRR
ncbi:hypothetical protein T5B8_06883 [Salinisphaera sp. T5B8]|uniref:hypothetical protein n=1 Tax=Salinisphaera sp. T5B8 TaxID=1304154 RepID=UPI003342D28F